MSDHKVYNTPLLNKIGIKENQFIHLSDAPAFIVSLLKNDSVSFDSKIKLSGEYDLIWTFVNSIQMMENQLVTYKARIRSNGMIWVSWYKKSSKKISELNENFIRDTALSIGLVDVKVVSVDEQWSALKLVIPVKDR